MRALAIVCGVLLICGAASAATEEEVNKVFTETHGVKKDWADYLADTAAGSVSAASLLGISGESVQPVDNVRDLVASLKGLSDDGDNATLAVSVTPGRTDMAPVSFGRYMTSAKWRVLASTTLSYAQGDADITGAKFERRAASIETSYFFNPEENDPVVRFGKRMLPGGDKCNVDTDVRVTDAIAASAKTDGEVDVERRVERMNEAIQTAVATGKDPNSIKLSDFPATVKDEQDKRLAKDAITTAKELVLNECYEATIKAIPWNRDRISIMYGTGWIKPKSGGGGQESLGQTAVASGTLGLGDFAFTAIYRKSWDEPVLDTLGTAAVQEKDNDLWVGRIEGGSSKIRALVEVSDARSKEVTASQRAFKQAFGLDIRIYEATWINLRVGRQRTVDGTEEETGSLLSVSYSPSALLN